MAAVMSINLDTSTPGVTTRRTAVVGESFVIQVMIEDDGTGVSPLVFDTIVFGVYFNDRSPDVLGVTKTHFPHAGEFLERFPGTVDAFSQRGIVPHMELSLWPVEDELPEGYLSQAGRAGFSNPKNPFTLYPGQGPQVVAAGKLNAGFRAQNVGVSQILASASVNSAEMLFRRRPIFAKTIPSTVTVIPEREDGPVQDFASYYRDDPMPPTKNIKRKKAI
ncbi:MAG: hypothetical protein JWO81_1726 [Alphaproteobacteria bacterium]|nr:hypothetical protein [Alphaproteobacteria bacterium]